MSKHNRNEMVFIIFWVMRWLNWLFVKWIRLKGDWTYACTTHMGNIGGFKLGGQKKMSNNCCWRRAGFLLFDQTKVGKTVYYRRSIWSIFSQHWQIVFAIIYVKHTFFHSYPISIIYNSFRQIFSMFAHFQQNSVEFLSNFHIMHFTILHQRGNVLIIKQRHSCQVLLFFFVALKNPPSGQLSTL